MESILPEGIVERLWDNLQTRSKSTSDQIHSRAVADYLSSDRFFAEKDKLFRKLPIVVAHSSQLPNPGDFIRHDRLGMPLVISRTRSGEVAAFRNICSHRAATVAPQWKGNCHHFICPYHHWTFDLDGTLKHVPDETSFDAGEFDALALKPIAVVEKFGLIFVRLEGDHEIDIDAFLGQVAPELEGLQLERHNFFADRDTPLDCNWKVMMEGSLEVYHFKFLHAQSAAGQFLPMSAIFDDYFPHQRHVMPRKDFPKRVEAADQPRRAVLPNYFIFPNTVLTFPHDHMTLTQVFPTDLGKCVFYNALLTLDIPGENKARDYWQRALDYTQAVNQEDFDAVESVQDSYRFMDAEERVIHGRYELGISRFHRACDQLLQGYGGPCGSRIGVG
jgi:phenylpropionate dioxygenase-like ring-hydroxylating dioxygenase large terminal subunit